MLLKTRVHHAQEYLQLLALASRHLAEYWKYVMAKEKFHVQDNFDRCAGGFTFY